MGVREGEARRLGEGAGCGTTVPLRSHEWVGPARWVPPGGSRPAEQQLRLPVPMTAAPEARAGAAGTGGSCGLPGHEEWWGRRGAPGKQRWARPGSQAPSFPQAPAPVYSWIGFLRSRRPRVRSWSPANSKEPRRATSARQTVVGTQTSHHSATRPGPR